MAYSFKLPVWMSLWLLFTSIMCTLDALFVILRPRTLPGGDLNFLCPHYNIYINIDTRYADLKDGFVIGQSWMNLVEVAINLYTLILSKKWSILTPVMALIVSTMTWSKTVLYFMMSSKLCGGDQFIGTTTWPQYMFLFILPNGIWIVVPMLCMASLSLQITSLIRNNSKHKTN